MSERRYHRADVHGKGKKGQIKHKTGVFLDMEWENLGRQYLVDNEFLKVRQVIQQMNGNYYLQTMIILLKMLIK